MKEFTAVEVLNAYVNYLPLALGASLQSYLVTRNLKKVGLTFLGFGGAGLIAVLGSLLDSDVQTVGDVNGVFWVLLGLGFITYE